VLHNVDVISTIDLQRMVQLHQSSEALATLAVRDRQTSRYLLFDENGQLCGRKAGREQAPEIVRASRNPTALAFSGIHVISPRLLSLMTEDGVFSIINSYLRLAALGEKVSAFRADEYYWRDLGKPENVAQTAKDVENGVVSL
jgi:NDP-sugar pyrophosphorylase family protein